MVHDLSAKRPDLYYLWLIAALVFLIFYFAGASNLNYFELDNYSYIINRDIWGEQTGSLSKSVMLYFDPQQLSSIMWKIFFLLPALFCISIWICYQRSFAEKICLFVARFLEARWCLFGSIALSFLAIIILVMFVTKARPLVDDEYAYAFQAKIYLSGRLAMPSPPVAKSFSNFNIFTQPVWTGKYLFGHPAFLAIGEALGSPYVASIGVSLASLALLFLLGVRTGAKFQAATATWLMAVSPWFWFTSSTFLSHTSSLFLFLLAAIGWTSLEKRQSAFVGLGTGLCLGWLFAVRPLTGLLLALPFVYLTATHMLKNPKNWLKVSGGLAIGGALVLGLVLLYNQAITGNAFQMPFSAYWPGEKLGFGGVRPVGHPVEIFHSPIKGIMNLAVSAIRANAWFLGWPLSFLPLLGLFAFNSAKKSVGDESWERLDWNFWDSLWVAIIIIFCSGYIFYYSSGVSDTGPVYYYELLVPLSLLSAKGILRAHRFLADRGSNILTYFVPVFCVISIVGSIIFFVPEKAYHNYRLCELAYYPFEMAEKEIKKKSIVFVGPRPLIGWLFNRPQASPKLDDKILFLRLLDEESNKRVIEAFPDRKPYRLTYDPKEQQFLIGPYESK